MGEINNIREKLRKVLGDSLSTSHVSDLPIDHQLTFKRDAGEWKFKDGHIYLNDMEIESLLDENREDVRFQSAVSEAVSDYKEYVCKKGTNDFDKFCARVSAIQDKILFNMKRIWDERTGGVSLTCDEGIFCINGIDVRKFLSLYRLRPTMKARLFLLGLKYKLALLLINKNGSPHFERANHLVRGIYEEVELALNNETPIDGRYLPDPSGRAAV